jgi:hypothetical protein
MIVFEFIGQVESFAQVPQGATILSVDDKEAVGRCMRCDKVVLEGEPGYMIDDDEDVLCRMCRDDTKEEATKEEAE